MYYFLAFAYCKIFSAFFAEINHTEINIKNIKSIYLPLEMKSN